MVITCTSIPARPYTEMKAAISVDLCVLKYKFDTSISYLAHPMMMGIPAIATPFNSGNALDDAMRDFDESTLPYAHHFLTNPHRISQIFKRLLTNDKIELLVFERPCLMRAKIPLHPVFFGEVGCRP